MSKSLLSNEKMNKFVDFMLTEFLDTESEAWFRTIEEMAECTQAITKLQRKNMKDGADWEKQLAARKNLIGELCQTMYMLEYYRRIIGISSADIDAFMDTAFQRWNVKDE